MRGILPILVAIASIVAVFWLMVAWVAPPPDARDGAQRVILAEIERFYDPTGTLTAPELETAEFETALARETHGSLPGQMWYRFKVEDAGTVAAAAAQLWIRFPNLDRVTLAYRDDAGAWQQVVTGDTLALNDRPLRSSQLGFALAMSEVADRPVYLGIRTVGLMSVSLTIGAQAEMQDRQIVVNIVSGIFFAALWVCLVIIAVLYVQTLAPIFVFFILSQLTYIIAAFSFTGYLSLLVPTIATDVITTQWIIIASVASPAFQVALFRVLKVRKSVLLAMYGVVTAFAALAVSHLFLDTRVVLEAGWYVAVVFAVVVVIGAWSLTDETYITKKAMRRIYGIYSLSILVWLLPNLGFLPATRIGFYGEVIRGLVNMSLVLTILFLIAKGEQRKRAQTQAQLRKLEEDANIQNHLSQMYRDILWTISHEFGNGLSIFRFAMSKPEITEANRLRMGRALSSLEELLAKFKHSEQVELGAISFQDTQVDLVALVRQEAKTATDGTDHVTVRLSQSEAISVIADEVCLRLIMSNLMSNAVKYAQPDSIVTVNFELVRDQVRVVVENTCPPQALPDPTRVFDRFYREPHVLQRAGSGLGLYIVQQLLKLLGGGCRFEIVQDNKVRVTAWMPKQA